MKTHRFPQRLVQWTSLSVCVALMVSVSTPPALASSLALEAFAHSQAATSQALAKLSDALKTKPTSQEPGNRGVKPRPPESKGEKEARVARLEIDPSGNVFLQPQQPIWFTAIPFDADGSAIHGLHSEWESSNKQVVFIKKTGQAMAGKPGSAILTARAGSLMATVHVIVTRGNGERFGGKKKQNSTRSNRRASQGNPPTDIENTSGPITLNGTKKHHAESLANNVVTSPLMPMRDPNDDPLPDNETSSLFQAANAIESNTSFRPATTRRALESSDHRSHTYCFSRPLSL